MLLLDSTAAHTLQTAVPDSNGRFSFSAIAPGSYRIGIRAGSLDHLWLGEPIRTLSLTVGTTGYSTVDVGTLCADSKPIGDLHVRADWQNGNSVTAPNHAALHLERFAGASTLSVLDQPGHALQVEWKVPVGDITSLPDSFSYHWGWPTDTTTTHVDGLVTDGRGSFARLHHPVRMHDHLITTSRYGGWRSFGDQTSRNTMADIVRGSAAVDGTWLADDKGYQAQISHGTGQVALVLYDSFSHAIAASVTLSTTVEVRSLISDAVIEIGLGSYSNDGATLRLVIQGAETKLLILHNDTISAIRRFPKHIVPSDKVQLILQFDPLTGDTSAIVGAGSIWEFVSTVLPLTDGRLRPRLVVERPEAAPPSAVDFVIEGYGFSSETSVYLLPSIPGELSGLVYDGTQGSESLGLPYTFVATESGIDARLVGKSMPVETTGFRSMEKVLFEMPDGNLMTALIAPDATIDTYTTHQVLNEAAVPISGGSAILY